MMDKLVLSYVERSVLCWLATVSADGKPNVSPKEIFAAVDDRQLVIAHIASPQSAKNILATGLACVSFVEVFDQRGYKVSGCAQLLLPDAQGYKAYAAPLEAKVQGAFAIRGVFVIDADAVEPVLAPSYRKASPPTQAQMREAAMRSYGVRPLQ